ERERADGADGDLELQQSRGRDGVGERARDGGGGRESGDDHGDEGGAERHGDGDGRGACPGRGGGGGAGGGAWGGVAVGAADGGPARRERQRVERPDGALDQR